jgi:hypothetical protein
MTIENSVKAVRVVALDMPLAVVTEETVSCEITDPAGHPVIVMRQGELEDRSGRGSASVVGRAGSAEHQ